MNPKTHKGHLAMLGANIMWGLMSPLSKAVLSEGQVSAFSLTTMRMLGGAIAFWIASLFTTGEHVPSHDMVRLFFAALLGVVINQGFFIAGVSLTSPIDASVVTTTMPIITMIIAAIYLKEPITGKKVIGIFFGALGALLLILGSGAVGSSGSGNLTGNLFCLFAQCCFATYLVVFKDLIGRYKPVTLMKWMFTYAVICFIPFSYSDLTSIDYAAVPSSIYLNILFIVFGATFLSYLLIPVGQRLLRPTVAGMYNYVQPIVASLVAVLWGMDTFGLVKMAAIVLVFTGVFLVTRSKSKARMQAEKEADEKTTGE